MNKIQEYLGFTRKSCPGLRANKAFIVVLILGIIAAFSGVVKAEDNETKKIVLKEWTTQLLYDTTNACYQGTIRWIVISNPSLIGQVPDISAQRQMLIHCFCVMDRIRNEIPIEEYQKLVYDQEWTGNTFMKKALECVKKEKTLPSFFTSKEDEEIKTTDNETKKVIPEESEDSKDELPSQKPKESEEDSTTIFQG